MTRQTWQLMALVSMGSAAVLIAACVLGYLLGRPLDVVLLAALGPLVLLVAAGVCIVKAGHERDQ